MPVRESYRGISKRLAVHYLEGLGGRAVDADGGPTDDAERVDRVEADDWTARLSTERVAVGQSLELTEVTVAFEGEDAALEDVVERFSQKAMRAGG